MKPVTTSAQVPQLHDGHGPLVASVRVPTTSNEDAHGLAAHRQPTPFMMPGVTVDHAAAIPLDRQIRRNSRSDSGGGGSGGTCVCR
jgi:hypothetical protein